MLKLTLNLTIGHLKSSSANTPLFYRESEIPPEPEFDRNADTNVGVGTRTTVKFDGLRGSIPIRIEGCVVAGIHYYPGKVGYDVYVPDYYDEDDGQTYTLVSNLDSINVHHLIKYKGEPRASLDELNDNIKSKI